MDEDTCPRFAICAISGSWEFLSESRHLNVVALGDAVTDGIALALLIQVLIFCLGCSLVARSLIRHRPDGGT
jgi:hypothetical protein